MRSCLPLSILLAACFLAVGGPAAAQSPQKPNEGSVSLQGDTAGFMNNPHMRAFYALSAATLRKGAPPLDVADYERRSLAIFRAFGEASGGSASAMEDHLKLIPRQIVQIAKDDASILTSFDRFREALIGPP